MSLTIEKRIVLYKIYWVKGGPNYCFYCSCKVSHRTRTLDHLTPCSLGGSDKPENIRLACIECNRAKADMTLLEFNQLVMKCGGIERVKKLYGKGSHSRRKMLAL